MFTVAYMKRVLNFMRNPKLAHILVLRFPHGPIHVPVLTTLTPLYVIQCNTQQTTHYQNIGSMTSTRHIRCMTGTPHQQGAYGAFGTGAWQENHINKAQCLWHRSMTGKPHQQGAYGAFGTGAWQEHHINQAQLPGSALSPLIIISTLQRDKTRHKEKTRILKWILTWILFVVVVLIVLSMILLTWILWDLPLNQIFQVTVELFFSATCGTGKIRQNSETLVFGDWSHI